jgi:hypothetical protein
MVTAMDSFDDAIRQHLDLKRRRGADPRVLADLAHEAFGPDVEAQDHRVRLPAAPFDGSTSASRSADWPGDGHYTARRAQLSQETVEIDMGAYINASRIDDRDQRPTYDWSADVDAPDIGDPASSFEWETPKRQRLRGAA